MKNLLKRKYRIKKNCNLINTRNPLHNFMLGISTLENLKPQTLTVFATLLTTALIFLLNTNTYALPDDRNQAIIFQSDEAEHDEIKGTLTYSGTVIMEQGSMKITADKVVVYGNKDKISKIEALGSPARFSQLPAIDGEPINAEANLLEYFIIQNSLHLIGNAALIQAGTSLSGNRIDYDVKKSIVKAGGGSNTTDTSNTKKRVKMVIPPRAFDLDIDKK